MNTKKEMLRKAAAFISALTFLSVSNMGTLSAMAAVTRSSGEPSAVSAKTPGSAPVATIPASTAATTTTTAPATTTTTSTTTTTTASTSTTTSTTTTTTAPHTDIRFAASIGSDDKDHIRDDIAGKLKNNSINCNVKCDDGKLIITYSDNSSLKAIQKVLKEWCYTKENGQEKLKEFSCNEALDTIERSDYYMVHGQTDLLNEAVALKNNNNKSYIKKGTILKAESFTLDKCKYVDGSLKVENVIDIKKDGVYINGKNKPEIEFKDKVFKLNLSTIDGETEIYDKNNKKVNDPDNFKYSDAKNFKVRIKSDDGRDKLIICGQDDRILNIDCSRSLNNGTYVFETTLDKLIGITENDSSYENDKTYEIKFKCFWEKVKAMIKYQDNGEPKSYFKEIVVNGSSCQLDPVIPISNKSYYLSAYTVNYTGTKVTKKPTDGSAADGSVTYTDIINLMNEGKSVKVDVIDSENSLKPVEDNSYLVLEYKPVDRQDESKDATLVFKCCYDAFDNKEKVHSNVVGEDVIIVNTDNNQCTLKLGDKYNGTELYYSVNGDEHIRHPKVQHGYVVISIETNLKYLRFYALNKKTGTDNTSFLMDPFYLFIDNKAPVVSVIDNINNDGWNNEEVFNLEIDEHLSSDEAEQLVGYSQNIDNISKIKIDDLVFEKTIDKNWEIGKTYTVTDFSLENEQYKANINGLNCEIADCKKELGDYKDAKVADIREEIENEKKKLASKKDNEKIKLASEKDSDELIDSISGVLVSDEYYDKEIEDLEDKINKLEDLLDYALKRDALLAERDAILAKRDKLLAERDDTLSSDFKHLSSFDDPYTVTITPKEKDNKRYFEVRITADKSQEKLYEGKLSITACDYSGNWSNAATADVEVECIPPNVTNIKLNSNSHAVKDICGKELKVSVTADDNITNNVSLVGYFKKSLDQKYGIELKDGKFDLSSFDGKSGYVVIEAKDKAGNEKTFYYCSETNVTDDVENATPIKVDLDQPEIEKTDLETNCGWVKSSPEIIIKAADSSRFGITELKVRVKVSLNTQEQSDGSDNETVERTIKLADLKSITGNAEKALADGKLSIKFEKNDGNEYGMKLLIDGKEVENDPFNDVSLELDSTKSIMFETWVFDYAFNRSEPKSVGFRIDNDPPEVGEEYTIEGNDEKNIRDFGAFANKQITIHVPVNDQEGASGVKDAELFINGLRTAVKTENVKYEDGKTYVEFTVPNEVIGDNYSNSFSLSVVAHDVAGNESKNTTIHAKGALPESKLMIENIAPVISSNVSCDNTYLAGDGKHWYNGDINIDFYASDKDSGVAEFKVFPFSKEQRERSGEYAESFKNGDAGSYKKSKITDSSQSVSIGKNERDGEYVYSVKVKDNAGNASESIIDNRVEESQNGNEKIKPEIVVYKDTKAPEISEISFDHAAGDPEGIKITDTDWLIGPRTVDTYSYFANSAVKMTVKVNDGENSAGVRDVYVALKEPDGKLVDDPFKCDKDESGFYTVIDKSFKGYIEVWADDNVNNISAHYYTNGLIVELPDTHNDMSNIAISIGETSNRDANGNMLFNRDVDARILVTELYSGVNTIKWDHAAGNGNAVFNGGEQQDNDASQWLSEGPEEWNIKTLVSREIKISDERNDNFINVRTRDNAGNEMEGRLSFSIDKTAPEFKLEGIDESDNVRYYNTSKTARVSLKERNYTDPVVNGSAVHFEPVSSEGDNGSPVNYHWEREYSSDGRYSLDIDCTDLAGNISKGIHTGTFVIDKTDPVGRISAVRSGGGPVRTGEGVFIDSDVDVNISVQEVNFDPADFNVTINGSEYRSDNWSSGDAHILTIPASYFANGGKYVINVTGKDRAGNNMKPVSTEFTLDKKKPVISIEGVKNANNGDVAPVVRIVEDNVKVQDLTIRRNNEVLEQSFNENDNTLTYRINNNLYITGKLVNSHGGGLSRVVFDNFPATEDYDGGYEISVSVTDMANNKTEYSQEFSVNRFGSVFTLENEENINGCYLSEAPEIKITERNVDKHSVDNDVVLIVDKGTDTIQLTADQYTVSKPVLMKDGSGYEYTYTIGSDVFDQDLSYSITIQSVDEAGNKNVSTFRGGDISFRLDTHEPGFNCDGLADRIEYKESERVFRLNATEQLKHIKVSTSLDGVLLDADGRADGNNSYEFSIPASNRVRDLTIELIDLAGNTTVKTFNDLLVTENIVLYAMHKTWAKTAAAAAAVIGAGVAGGAVIAGRRKKKLL